MRNIRPGWESYFEQQHIPNLFAGQLPYYQAELNELLRDKSNTLRTKDEKGLYVLGGFFPSESNVQAIHTLAEMIDPSSTERVHYMDMNPAPLKVLTPEQQARFHQIDLRQIATEFGAGKIDLITLDHIIQFLDDDGAEEFFRVLSTALSPEGVALMTTTNPSWTWLESIIRSKDMGVKVYPRKREKREQMIQKHLKIVSGAIYTLEGIQDACLYTLARQDSPYPAHSGKYGKYSR